MNISLEKQFTQPLKYINIRTRRKLYKKVIITGSLCLLIGLTIFFLLPVVLPVLDPNAHYGARRNDGAMGFILICMAFGLPPYGIWQLVTIKSRASALARKELVKKETKFSHLEAKRKQNLTKQLNQLLKITTFIASIVVVILIVVATFMLLNYKEN